MKFFTIIGGIVMFGLWAAISGLWSAFVLTKLWWWFVVPLFHLPPLTLALAYGLWVLAAFLGPTARGKSADETHSEFLTRSVIVSLLSPAIALGLGWVAHWFV